MFRKELQLANNIKFYRRLNDLTQDELGRLIGKSDRSISTIERGNWVPNLELAMRFAKVFDMPVEELFFEKGHEPELRIVKMQQS